jgi:transposase
MANRLTMDKSLAVNNLRAVGYSERRIAQTLEISRGAVRRHLAATIANSTKAPTGSAPTGTDDSNSTKAPTGSDDQDNIASPPTSASQCEPFRRVILEMLDQGLSAKRIHQDLIREHDFTGKYWSVNRFVTKLSANSDLPFRRIEVQPGEELQVDFGTGAKIRMPDGSFRRTHVFRAVLSHSRKGYTEAVFRQTTEEFIRVLENAFWHFGGVPQTIVFDNAKCAVIKADWYDPELNPKIVDFCKHYGCAFIPTRPRTPRHKGKVERGVDYVQENALRGREFDSLAKQNEHLAHWERTVADTRIHGTTRKQVTSHFQSVEKDALGKLPLERFPFYHEGKRKVSRDGHLAVQRSYYSAPPEYLGCDVWVRYDSRLLRIFNSKMELIATHVVAEPGRFSTKDAHLDPRKISAVEKGIEYFLRKTRLLGPSACRWAEAVVATRGVEASRVLQGLLSLTKKYTSDSINDACEKAWRSNALNYRTIKRLLEADKAASQTNMEFMDSHPIIRPVSEYADFVHESIQGG